MHSKARGCAHGNRTDSVRALILVLLGSWQLRHLTGEQPPPSCATHLVEGLLLVGGDGAVGGGVGDAGQNEAVAHLSVIQEGLVGLVDGAGGDLAGAAGAGSGAARVGQVKAGLLQKR